LLKIISKAEKVKKADAIVGIQLENQKEGFMSQRNKKDCLANLILKLRI